MIRALAPGDVDAVVSVLGLARLHQGDGVYLVAWEGTEPVGHLHLALTDPPELQDVEVREAFRGRGIGTELIAAAEAECAMRRRRAVHVTVSVDNEGARALYERLGYRDSGLAPRRVTGTIEIRSGPIEVDDTLVILEKRLDA